MTNTPRLTTVDAYIESFPEPTRTALEQIRQAIHRAAPDVVETISYAIPTFDRNGKHLVFVAGWKRHISLYPIPAGDSALQHDIAPYRKARGTLQFPLAKPVPYDLVARIVSFLVAER
jgi:uncharacterized protein YdhG (YjbR/CyaY superfamily)